MTRRIKVSEISPGMFESERYVILNVENRPYSLMVDESSLKGDTLEVSVVAQNGDTAIIELPRDTFNAGSRIRVPKSMLLAA